MHVRKDAVSRFRKRPVVIEAFKWTGGPAEPANPQWAVDAIKSGRMSVQDPYAPSFAALLDIRTPEGMMHALPGDWIIKGVKEEIYPCKPDIFEMTYESVE